MGDKSEDQRLTIERRLAFLEEWRTNLTPIQESIASADRGAIDFALAGLKSGFLLNGGALIAVPAFAEILSLGLPARPYLIDAVVLFVCGLILCTLATLAAYLSMRDASMGLVAQRESRTAMVSRFYGGDPTGERTTLETDQDSEATRRGAQANRTANIGLVLFLLSLAAFIAGAVVTAFLFASAPL